MQTQKLVFIKICMYLAHVDSFANPTQNPKSRKQECINTEILGIKSLKEPILRMNID